MASVLEPHKLSLPQILPSNPFQQGGATGSWEGGNNGSPVMARGRGVCVCADEAWEKVWGNGSYPTVTPLSLFQYLPRSQKGRVHMYQEG